MEKTTLKAYVVASYKVGGDEHLECFVEPFVDELVGTTESIPGMGDFQLDDIHDFVNFLGHFYTQEDYTVHHVTCDPEHPAVSLVEQVTGLIASDHEND